jgi:hypothetical protein
MDAHGCMDALVPGGQHNPHLAAAQIGSTGQHMRYARVCGAGDNLFAVSIEL